MKHIHKYYLIEVNVTYMETCHINTYQQNIIRERRENTVIGVDIIYKTHPHKYKSTKNIIHGRIFKIN